MYKNLMLSRTLSNFFEPSQTVLSLFLQTITKLFLHFNNVENSELVVRGRYAPPPQQGQIQHTKSRPYCEGDAMHVPQ